MLRNIYVRNQTGQLLSKKLSLDDLSGFGSLLLHLLRESEVGYACDVVAAHLGSVSLQLLVCEIHLAQCLEDAGKVHFALAHGGVLVDGDICSAAGIEPRRVEDVTAVLGLVPGIREEDVGQLVAGILEHVADIALALIIEETVGCAVDIAQVGGAERLDQIAGLVIELAEIVRVGLHFDTEAFLLDDGKEFFHGAEPHAVADLLLIGIAGELGVDDRNAHVDGDLDDLLPVGYCVLSLLLSGAGPAINNDEGRDLDARVLQSLAVLRLTLFGEQRVFVEGIDPGVGGLLDIFVAPVRYLVDHVFDAHLFCENVYIKSNFHNIYLPSLSL